MIIDTVIASVVTLLCCWLFMWGFRWRQAARTWQRRTGVLTAILRTKTNGLGGQPAGRWRCTVCKEMHGIAEMAAHEHRDDPRSSYYEPKS